MEMQLIKWHLCDIHTYHKHMVSEFNGGMGQMTYDIKSYASDHSLTMTFSLHATLCCLVREIVSIEIFEQFERSHVFI